MKDFERELVGDDVDDYEYDITKITIAPRPENAVNSIDEADERFAFTWRDGSELLPGAIEVWARFV